MCAIAVRDVTKSRDVDVPAGVLTDDTAALVRRDDIDIVIELMGGTDKAKEFVLSAIQHGKHVVTGNKALIALEGRDVFEAAHAHEVGVYLEASVAGGIPIIRSLHGGLSANPDNVVRIMDDVVDNIGTLPDFGNVAPDIRYEAMEKLAPYAIAVHAKTHEFGDDGEDLNIDIGRCVRIMKDAGYDGSFGIEFEGAGSDHEGVLKTKALLERYL